MIEETLAIPEYEIDTVYSLTLVDTTKEKDVHVSDYLIENGFAVPCEEEQNALAAANLISEYSTAESIPSPSVEPSATMPSPVPTCAFPSSAVNSITNQLRKTGLSCTVTSQTSNNEKFDVLNTSIDEFIFSESNPTAIRYEESVIASVKEPVLALPPHR